MGRKTSDLWTASPGLSVHIHVSLFCADTSPLVRRHPDGRIRTWSSVMLEQRPPEKVPFGGPAGEIRWGGGGGSDATAPKAGFPTKGQLACGGGGGGRARGGGRPGGP